MKIFLIITFVFTSLSYAQEPVTTAEIYEHISFLASDSLKGRKPGTPEGKIAANYIAEQFKSYGLKPLGKEGSQFFKVVSSVELGEGNYLVIKNTEYKAEEDYIPLGFSDNNSIDAEVVFTGYGFQIDTDSLKWDDYKDIDVENKWVLVLRGDPENDPHGGKYMSHNSLRKKALVAKDNKAAGIIFVSGPLYEEDDELMKLSFDQSKSTAGIPVIQIKRNVANEILKDSGKTIAALEESLNKNTSVRSFNSKCSVKANVNVNHVKVQTQNVLAVLEGADETLKDEYIVIGGHYDHLGFGGWGSGSRQPDTVAIHNGADDNASGVTAILEIAENLSSQQLKRSILFMCFGAEEMGLLGSKFFVSDPLIDLKKVRIMLNLDMVGRLDDSTHALTLGGTGTAKDLEDFVKKTAEDYNLRIKTSSEGYGPSDHASFYGEDIPVLFLFTGTHDDYHKPSDDYDKINLEGIKTISEYAIEMIRQQANEITELTFTEAGPKTQQRRMRFKVTLGVIPDYASDAKGLRLDGVKKGGPADNAGMLKGDIVISMDGKEVGNIYDYMGRLQEMKKGKTVVVEVKRGEEIIPLDVTF